MHIRNLNPLDKSEVEEFLFHDFEMDLVSDVFLVAVEDDVIHGCAFASHSGDNACFWLNGKRQDDDLCRALVQSLFARFECPVAFNYQYSTLGATTKFLYECGCRLRGPFGEMKLVFDPTPKSYSPRVFYSRDELLIREIDRGRVDEIYDVAQNVIQDVWDWLSGPLLVAFLDGVPVGVAAFCYSHSETASLYTGTGRPVGLFCHVEVNKDHRLLGIGTKLLKALEKLAVELECSLTAELDQVTSEDVCDWLYANGWAIDGEDYWTPRLDGNQYYERDEISNNFYGFFSVDTEMISDERLKQVLTPQLETPATQLTEESDDSEFEDASGPVLVVLESKMEFVSKETKHVVVARGRYLPEFHKWQFWSVVDSERVVSPEFMDVTSTQADGDSVVLMSHLEDYSKRVISQLFP